MNFSDFLRKYTNFNGRASKKEFWSLFILLCIPAFILGFLSGFLGFSEHTNLFLKIIFGFIIALPIIATSVRRLHDINQEGSWLLLGLIPIIGLVVLFVILSKESFPDANRFGPSPDTGISNDSVGSGGQEVIKHALAQGKTIEEIELELISFGWTKRQIRAALDTSTSIALNPESQKSVPSPRLIPILSIFVILVLFVFSFAPFSKNKSLEKENSDMPKAGENVTFVNSNETQLSKDADILCAYNLAMSLSNSKTSLNNVQQKSLMEEKFNEILNTYNLTYNTFPIETKALELRISKDAEYHKKIYLLMPSICRS